MIQQRVNKKDPKNTCSNKDPKFNIKEIRLKCKQKTKVIYLTKGSSSSAILKSARELGIHMWILEDYL